MSLQILTPDLGSSAFPMRSAHSAVVTSSKGAKVAASRRKRVRFSQQLTNEYEIPSRYCRRLLSVSTEQLRNKVLNLRRQLDADYDYIENQEQIELMFENKIIMYAKFTDVTTMVKLKNSIDILTSVKEKLEEDIEFMRIDMLRLKGTIPKSLAKTANDKLARTKTSENLPFNLARTLWIHALGSQRNP